MMNTDSWLARLTSGSAFISALMRDSGNLASRCWGPVAGPVCCFPSSSVSFPLASSSCSDSAVVTVTATLAAMFATRLNIRLNCKTNHRTCGSNRSVNAPNRTVTLWGAGHVCHVIQWGDDGRGKNLKCQFFDDDIYDQTNDAANRSLKTTAFKTPNLHNSLDFLSFSVKYLSVCVTKANVHIWHNVMAFILQIVIYPSQYIL